MNNRIQLCVASVTCTTVNRDFAVCKMLLITCSVFKMENNICREVDEVREERFSRRECDRLRRDKVRKNNKVCKPLSSPLPNHMIIKENKNLKK